MRRMPGTFYKELKTIRDAYVGEYDRDVLIPATKALLRKHLKDDDALLHDAAIEIIDRLDKADNDPDQGRLFREDDHVILGEKRRIKRESMTIEHLQRRRNVIDENRAKQDAAWARESLWLRVEISLLEHLPAGTTRKQARPLDDEEGTG